MGFVVVVFVVGVKAFVVGLALGVLWNSQTPTPTDPGRRRQLPRAGTSAREQLETGHPPQTLPGKPQAAQPHNAPSPATPAETPESAAERKAFDLEALRRAVAASGSSLTDFASRLNVSDHGDFQRSVWGFVAELQEICQPYKEKLNRAAETLSDQLSDVANELVLEQLAQLETTLSNLQHMDFGSGVLAATRRLSKEAENTLSTTRKLQESLEARSNGG
jgi:hypothetical protein